MRLRGFVFLFGSALALAACAQKPVVQRVAPPNPFGYQKKSAVCQTTPIVTAADGSKTVSMTVRSDDGLCALKVQQADNTNYASFGVSPTPQHGKAFLYNYDGATYVNYTPSTAYAGTDSFTAVLIPGGGRPRVKLAVTASVDATGVPVAQPAPAPAAPAATTTSGKKKSASAVRRKHTTHR
ncbi:hypothetical protein AA101099_0047 [Neoasaia chiangmaiensis NBRC 101099]|uniref:Uncharacterized protein n=2 Tax=Neoasaia chiangmaiensis TaxID=320497 RepID=A0A1U9KLV5_9PROT|nr:hypothetical protein A0U93_01075 [Neoasaia chiangmaiensis]GBR35489.1 hypothetical protein AA101099_0047 [Neoasaia chiangmaiensis NBRC 101099]GEN16366.1 hypothetical protein NCH01_27970 [Neoasaia chiangmaiensis]